MKFFLMAIVVLLDFAFTTQASAPDNKKLLVGKWEVVKSDLGTLPEGVVVEFTNEGKMKLTLKKDGKEATVEGGYVVDGDSYTYKMIDGDAIHEGKITIKNISETELETANSANKSVSFRRVK
jgi:uncharacterized protein (TIGR03066 family)